MELSEGMDAPMFGILLREQIESIDFFIFRACKYIMTEICFAKENMSFTEIAEVYAVYCLDNYNV